MNIPAFPLEMVYTQENEKFNGMTLRDYFAAKAMQGLMATERAGEYVDEEGYEMIGEEGESGTLFIHTKFFVEEAYMIADMMLKAREA
jgi:hypothetical protein